jgi:hypothetical protein
LKKIAGLGSGFFWEKYRKKVNQFFVILALPDPKLSQTPGLSSTEKNPSPT